MERRVALGALHLVRDHGKKVRVRRAAQLAPLHRAASDECESLFASRGHGGSAEMTELLTEIERRT